MMVKYRNSSKNFFGVNQSIKRRQYRVYSNDIPGESEHPLGHDVPFVRTEAHRSSLPECGQPFVDCVVAQTAIPTIVFFLRLQVETPGVRVNWQPRLDIAVGESGVHGCIPLERRPKRVPGHFFIIDRTGLPSQRVLRLRISQVGVFHTNFLTHVRESRAWQQQIQHVHSVHHFPPEPCGYTRPIVVSNLRVNHW